MNTERLTSLAISDTGFIFDPITGQTYNSNETGIEVINLLKGGKTIEEITEILSTDYKVSRNDLELDLLDFTLSLKNLFLVQNAFIEQQKKKRLRR